MKKQFFTKTLALSLLFSSAFLLTNAQAPNVKWQKTIGGSNDDYNNYGKITLLHDGNYLMVGATASGDGNFPINRGDYDGYVVKFNAQGNIIWAKTYGGSGDDKLNGVVERPDGSIIVAGMTSSNDDDVSGNHGGYDGWIIHISKTGNLLSQRCYGGTGDELIGELLKINNGYAFAGTSTSNDGDVSGNHGDIDAWVVKLNLAGNIVWSKSFGGSNFENFSGFVSVGINFMLAGVTGSTDNDMQGNHGDWDLFFLGLNSLGNKTWSHIMGGSGRDGGTYNVAKANDGSVIIPAYTNSNDGDVISQHGLFDMWITKVNPNNGNIIWQKCIGTSQDETANGVMPLANGDIIVLGATATDIWDWANWDAQVLRTDNNGNVLWTKTISTPDFEEVEKAAVLPDGGLLLLGSTSAHDSDHTNNDIWDIWLVKLGGNNCNHKEGFESQTDFSISNYPNPISTSTTISIVIPSSNSLSPSPSLSLKIYDVSGKLISTLCENKSFKEGEYQLEWNAEKVDAGIYFLKVEGENFSETKKLSVVK